MSKTKQSNNPRHFNFTLSTRQTVVAMLSIFALVTGLQTQAQAEPKMVETPGVPAQVLAEAKHETPEIPASAQTIQITPGVNEIIPVAVGHLNRIVTPFDKPHVRTVSQATTQIEGNVLYVATPDENPVALYITPGETEDFALSLTLAPRKIPPREVRLTLDAVHYQKLTALQNAAGVNGQDDKSGNPSQSSQDYVADIKSVFRALALMRTPKGYALRNPSATETIRCSQPGLFTHTGQVLEGRNRVLLVGVARNNGTSPLEISLLKLSATKKRYDISTRYVNLRHYPKSSIGWNRDDWRQNIAHGVENMKTNHDKFFDALGNEDMAWKFAISSNLTGPNKGEYLQGKFPTKGGGHETPQEYTQHIIELAEQWRAISDAQKNKPKPDEDKKVPETPSAAPAPGKDKTGYNYQFNNDITVWVRDHATQTLIGSGNVRNSAPVPMGVG